MRRELRTQDEVATPAALATLTDAPVTDTHRGRVTSENYSQVAAGHVSGAPRLDDSGGIVADLVIQDAALLRKIESGEARQVSCGYDADLDETPGEHPTEGRYDAIQRNVRYNHVAVVQSGRAGPSCALRLDAAGDATEDEEVQVKLTLDGKEYDLSVATELAAYNAAIATLKARADAAEGARDAERARADVAVAEAAPARLDAMVAERIALIDSARKVLGPDYVAVGKAARQIKLDAIAHSDSTDYSSKSDAYIDGRFDALATPATSPLARAAAATIVSDSQNAVSTPRPVPAWKQPLAASRK